MKFYGSTHLNVCSYENNWIQYEGSKISMVHWFISRFHNQQERGETIFKQVLMFLKYKYIYITYSDIKIYIYTYKIISTSTKNKLRPLFSWHDQVTFQDFIQDSLPCLSGGSGGTCCDRFGRGQVPFSQLRVLVFWRVEEGHELMSFFGFLWNPKVLVVFFSR